MLPTKIYTLTLATGETNRLLIQGQYFKILGASGTVSVSSDFGTLENLTAGQGLENTPFNSLTLINTSGNPNTIRVLIGDENFIDGMTGNVGISSNTQPQSGAFVNAQATVTNVSAQLMAANAKREYLLIQNKDASGSIFINFGAAATLANGVQIPPGGAYELPGCISTQDIFAIGSQASNANIVTVQG